MGQFFYDMGLLSTAEYLERSATDLVGSYVGQTGPKTVAVLKAGLGKVLFIDEAYRLGEGPFAKEAIDELVDCLTKPQFLGKLVVILAGYDDGMNQLLEVNPGLSSRFPEEIVFRNMTPDECLTLLQRQLLSSGVSFALPSDQPLPKDEAPKDEPWGERESELEQNPQLISTSAIADSNAHADIIATLIQLSDLPNWGNGRDVKTLAKTVASAAFAAAPSADVALTVSTTDVATALGHMLDAQRARSRTNSVERSPRHRHISMLGLRAAAPPLPQFKVVQEEQGPPVLAAEPGMESSTLTAEDDKLEPEQRDQGHEQEDEQQAKEEPRHEHEQHEQQLNDEQDEEQQEDEQQLVSEEQESEKHESQHQECEKQDIDQQEHVQQDEPHENQQHQTEQHPNETRQQEQQPQQQQHEPAERRATSSPFYRDAGVPDDIWDQLQLDFRAHELETKTMLATITDLERRAKNLAADHDGLVRADARAATALASSTDPSTSTAKDTDAATATASATHNDIAADGDGDDGDTPRPSFASLQQRRHESMRIARARAAAAARAAEESARAARERLETRRRDDLRAQRRLREMGVCPVGFRWVRQADGYRCSGGVHFVTHDELGMEQ